MSESLRNKLPSINVMSKNELKMKRIAAGLLFAMVTILVCSCDGISSYMDYHPKNYQTEIEDFVRFRVSEANYIIDNVVNLYSFDRLSSFDDEILKLTHNDNSKNSYEKALSRIANDSSNQYRGIAKKLLDEYKKTRVVLSDYKKVPTSSQTMVWEFKEINTGIRFYFSINEKEYEVRSDDDSVRQYLEKYLL